MPFEVISRFVPREVIDICGLVKYDLDGQMNHDRINQYFRVVRHFCTEIIQLSAWEMSITMVHQKENCSKLFNIVLLDMNQIL